MDHCEDGFERHAKQEDMESFNSLKEIMKLIEVELALPSLEEMRMSFSKKNCHPWRNSNLWSPDSSTLPEVLNLAKGGHLKNLKTLISKDGGKSVFVKTKDGQTVLHFAASGGHTRICEFLISELRFDINIKDSMGRTPLHEAASGNHLDALCFLIDQGADVNARASMDLTALHFATEAGSLSVIPLLISKGLDVNAASYFGTPLWIASIQSQEEAMKILLLSKAKPDIFLDGMLSPLLASILTCSQKCVKELLLAGADPNIESCGVFPLEAAIKCGDSTIFELLLNKGAIQNMTGDTRKKAEEVYSLYKSVGQRASEVGKYHTSFIWYIKEAVARLEEIQNCNESKLDLPAFEKIRMLIGVKVAVFHCSNLDHENPDARTSKNILHAVVAGDIATLKRLVLEFCVKSGNSLSSLKTSWLGETVLHLAACGGYTHMCKYLISELNFDMNIRDSGGRTPLHAAAIQNETRTLSDLIDYGADLNAVTFYGQTALHLAIEAGSLDALRLLIPKFPDLNSATHFHTPLCSAAIYNQEQAMQILLSSGAKPNEFPEGTHSPLYCAIANNSYECMEQLLLAKADPNIKSCGAPLLDYTIKFGNIRFFELLLKWDADPNILDDYGLTPLEWAVLEENEGMVKKLFPLTKCIPYIKEWSVNGVWKHYESIEAKTEIQLKGEKVYSLYNSKGERAYEAGKYYISVMWYTEVINTEECDQALVRLKRSLSWLQLREYGPAMTDALACLYNAESKSPEALCVCALHDILYRGFERGVRQFEEACQLLQCDKRRC